MTILLQNTWKILALASLVILHPFEALANSDIILDEYHPSIGGTIRDAIEVPEEVHLAEKAGKAYAGVLCMMASPNSWGDFWGPKQTKAEVQADSAMMARYWKSHGYTSESQAGVAIKRYWGTDPFKEGATLAVQETTCSSDMVKIGFPFFETLNGPAPEIK